MKILVRFNKNIAIPRQVKSFKLFDLGIVSTTIDDLLDSTTIEIDDQTLPILKINNSSFSASVEFPKCFFDKAILLANHASFE